METSFWITAQTEVQHILQKQVNSFFGLHKFTTECLMEETKGEKGRGQGGLGGEVVWKIEEKKR